MVTWNTIVNNKRLAYYFTNPKKSLTIIFIFILPILPQFLDLGYLTGRWQRYSLSVRGYIERFNNYRRNIHQASTLKLWKNIYRCSRIKRSLIHFNHNNLLLIWTRIITFIEYVKNIFYTMSFLCLLIYVILYFSFHIGGIVKLITNGVVIMSKCRTYFSAFEVR